MFGRSIGARSEAPIALFGSIPLIWAEGNELLLDAPPPWPRAVIESRGKPVPIDSLEVQNGRSPLAGINLLVLAQPRALGAQENVALDAWVRGGGKVLLLADPMYTGHSALALGDPRRPQAIAMISPILARWGLELEYDPDQPPGPRPASAMGTALSVNLAGRFVVKDPENCRLWDNGLVATCRIGKGRIFALADASVIDPDDPSSENVAALGGLLDAAFSVR
ncbi:MAG: ABC transporter [Novosphingobium sp.]|uniref:Gldg family protein n=1 Tax=Novosphingobium sp. TaxID=1874826 RepID=UPI0032B9251A